MYSLEASIQDLSAQSRAEDSDPEKEARIQRVLNGLRPPVSIDGEPPATLTDRMKALCIPGVSIAVIRDGAIDWARGYGMTGNGDAAVTELTLFQAASISRPVSAVAALTLVQAGRLDLDTENRCVPQELEAATHAFY
jgi:CubicO group peptidase (beta-lactamase class C family)